MAGDDREFSSAATMDLIGIAVAFSSGEIHKARGGEFIERHAVLIGGDIGALGLCDLCEVHANAGETDGLGWRGSGIRGGHLLYIKEIDATDDDSCDEDQRESSHKGSLAQPSERDKRFVGGMLCRSATRRLGAIPRATCKRNPVEQGRYATKP